MELLTYRTLDGRVLDLSKLSEAEAEYVAKCRRRYREGASWVEVSHLVESAEENPLLRPTGGVITREVWEHPAFQVARDLEDRAGMRDGSLLRRPDFDPDEDPFAEEWLSPGEAAERKGVSTVAIHKAIQRGDLIARPAREGGTWRVISRNSLEAWTPRRRTVRAR
jgi:hypothetical protein